MATRPTTNPEGSGRRPSIGLWIGVAVGVVLIAGVVVLGFVGYREYAIRAYVEAIRDGDTDEQDLWLRRFIRMGALRPALRRAFEETNMELFVVGEPANRRLVAIACTDLTDESEPRQVRWNAVQVLYWLSGSTDFTGVIGRIEELATHETDVEIRALAIQAYGDARPNTPAPPFLLKALRSPVLRIRTAAVTAILTCEPTGREREIAVSLVELLDDPDPEAVSWGLSLLPVQGWEVMPHFETIVKLTRHEDYGVREVAVSTIANLGLPTATSKTPAIDPDLTIDALVAVLDQGDASLKSTAAMWLIDYGPLAKPAVPRLVAMLKAEEEYVREAAAEALLAIDRDAAIAAGVQPTDDETALFEAANDPE